MGWKPKKDSPLFREGKMWFCLYSWPPPGSEYVKSDQSDVSGADVLRVKLGYRTRYSWYGQTQLFYFPLRNARNHIQHEVLSSDLAVAEDLITGTLMNSSELNVSEDLVILPLGVGRGHKDNVIQELQWYICTSMHFWPMLPLAHR